MLKIQNIILCTRVNLYSRRAYKTGLGKQNIEQYIVPIVTIRLCACVLLLRFAHRYRKMWGKIIRNCTSIIIASLIPVNEHTHVMMCISNMWISYTWGGLYGYAIVTVFIKLFISDKMLRSIHWSLQYFSIKFSW